MFTGLVEEIGTVTHIEPSGDGAKLSVQATTVLDGVQHGDSIAVSGTCLTVVSWGPTGFVADVMRQSLEVTTLGAIRPGDRVNLERATAAGGRLGGHIVQGHVDGQGTVTDVRPGDEWRVVRMAVPTLLAPLVVDKGSITIDGVSLTVSAVSAAYEPAPWLEVSLIPETLAATTLGDRLVGDAVNIETDILARHVQRLLAFGASAPEAAPAKAPASFATGDTPPANFAVLTAPLPTEGGSR
ncbi:MAG: riboflavin synthase [Microbacterium sp.]